MEKKTIGKFIAILRKANGMTQRELGEKLLVSDKTVSRWENDEFLPDISLLTAIAEIFGITTDELLRGERNNPEREDDKGNRIEINQTTNDKQSQDILDKKMKRYKTLTCVSIAIAVVGMIAGLLLRIFMGWWVDITTTAIFVAAAEICQIIFAIEAFIKLDKDDVPSKEVAKFNRRVVGVASWFSILNLSIPLNAVWALRQIFVHSISYGFFPGLAVTQIVALYVIYTFAIRKILIYREVIVYGEKDAEIFKFNTKLLKKMTIICGIVACVLVFVMHNFVSPHMYYNIGTTTYGTFEEFKEHYESDYDQWCEEIKDNYWIRNEQGELVYDQAGYDAQCADHKKVGYLEDENGNMHEYYCISSAASVTSHSSKGDKIYNIRVTSMEEAYKCVQVGRDCFGFVFVLYFGICAVIYKSKIDKNKKKVLAGADVNDADDNKAEDSKLKNLQLNNPQK